MDRFHDDLREVAAVGAVLHRLARRGKRYFTGHSARR